MRTSKVKIDKDINITLIKYITLHQRYYQEIFEIVHDVSLSSEKKIKEMIENSYVFVKDSIHVTKLLV